MRTITLAAVTVVLLATDTANAAGLYFSDRGVRPMARGGAFVAGADDLGAIYYNPAGLVDAGTQFLLDASWLRFSGSFQRKIRVQGSDPNTGAPVGSSFIQTYEKVEGSSPVLPIPTLAGSYAIRPNLVVAGGVYAPYSAITSYPEKLPNGQPAPQRYSLLTLDGSALAIGGIWLAYRPTQRIQVGAGPTVLAGTFQSEVYFSACVPDRFLCAPEQPDYDTKGRLRVEDIVAPSGTLGLVVTPIDLLRIGTSFQLPSTVDAPAKLQTRLPSAAVFDKAYIDGDSARVRFQLPWIARLGVELRPSPATRIEAAFVYEKWSLHERIDVTPNRISLRDVALFPPEYRIGSISLERRFQDAWSMRIGGEQVLRLKRYRIDLRAGLSYEKSAVPPPYLSVLTLDMDKFLVGFGGSLHLGSRWRFDGTLAMLFPSRVDVSPDDARLYKINPVRANKPPEDLPINAGRYEVNALLLGLGLRYQFGVPEAPH
ncbi:MAG: outer membrane protein transport protein [Polyangiaceae bacterium]|nr:outer membrane protein transport protein [Polyangiaceae bacterium]